jgi:EmrB/QacA subfamily drug resistance transporter
MKDQTMTALAITAPIETTTLDPKRWAALVILLTGWFMAPLDFFIVNVAMPSIRAGLHASPAEIQLVISGYAVVFAVFLITGGRLGDLYGRKSIFLIGLAGFALASLFCGLAESPAMLISGRLLQALAAAAMAPQALASIHALFPPRERGLALSIYGIVLGLSAAAGQLLGGILVAANIGGLGWRLIFLVNLPVAIVTILAAALLLRQTHAQNQPRFDWGGVALSSAALTVLIVPLVIGREQGWPLWSVIMLLTTPIFVESFRRYEIRLGKAGGDPLIAIEVFHTPGLLRGLGAIMTLYTMSAFFLTFSIYLQSALGFTALQSGVAIVPFSLGFLAGSSLSPLVGRVMGRTAPSLGFVLSAAGGAATALIAGHVPAGTAPPWHLILAALTFVGMGMGMSIPNMVRVIIERVEPHRAGLVGGIVNSTLQVSAAIGVAVLGGLFFTILGARTDPASVTHAFSITLLGVAACHLGGALLAAGLGQRQQS